MRRTSTWAYCLALGLVLAGGYVLIAPHTADLAAQEARAELFRRSGLVAYWSGWYSGIPTATYSLLSPPLLAVFGPVWLGALSLVATSVVAAPLLRDSRRPVLGATFVIVAGTLDAISGRATFALGATVALVALLAVERRRTGPALVLGALTSAASPVAGFLLVLVAVVLVLADGDRRRPAVAAGAGAGVMLLVMAVLAHGADGGGYEPMTRNTLLMALGTTLVVAAAPVSRRVRAGVAVTAVMLLAVYCVHSAVGANATRIAVLGAAPTIIASARQSRGPWPAPRMAVAVVLASLLPLAQLHNDLGATSSHDGSRSFVAGLQARLAADPLTRDHRVELVDTSTHWPSTYLLPTATLARGWERQVDESANPLFYGRASLTASTYRGFLDRSAVGEVAVAQGVGLDYGSTREASLIGGGLPYLHEIWSDPHWRLYQVSAPTALVDAPAEVVDLSDTGLTVRTPGPGTYLVRMRWAASLVAAGGSVQRAAGGNVDLVVRAAGDYRIHGVWRLP